MAVIVKNGHGVTSVLPSHADAVQVGASQPNFTDAPQASQSTPSNMSIGGTAKPKKVSGPSR